MWREKRHKTPSRAKTNQDDRNKHRICRQFVYSFHCLVYCLFLLFSLLVLAACVSSWLSVVCVLVFLCSFGLVFLCSFSDSSPVWQYETPYRTVSPSQILRIPRLKGLQAPCIVTATSFFFLYAGIKGARQVCQIQ